MNERITLLALKASNPKTGWLDRQKFAELIVEECAGLFVDQKYMILNPNEPFANERVRALKEHDKDTVRKIKGHFGVEE
jgi:hypothetical protein